MAPEGRRRSQELCVRVMLEPKFILQLSVMFLPSTALTLSGTSSWLQLTPVDGPGERRGGFQIQKTAVCRNCLRVTLKRECGFQLAWGDGWRGWDAGRWLAAATHDGNRRKKNNVWYQSFGAEKKIRTRFFSSDCHFYYTSAKARTPEHSLRPLHVLQQPWHSAHSPNRRRVEDLTTDLLSTRCPSIYTLH